MNKKKKAFISWSGGKDCTFALHKFLQKNGRDTVACLLNMDRATTQNAHRLTGELLYAQAEAIGIELLRERVEEGNTYSHHFERVVTRLREEGVEYGVFGDIYLQAHRDWIEAMCRKLYVTPIFPLWGMDVHEIFTQFVEDGFEAKIIAIKNEERLKDMLGQNLSIKLYERMIEDCNFDVCGENGEYHTFVVDGPIFKEKVDYRIVAEYEDNKIHALELDKAL